MAAPSSSAGNYHDDSGVDFFGWASDIVLVVAGAARDLVEWVAVTPGADTLAAIFLAVVAVIIGPRLLAALSPANVRWTASNFARSITRLLLILLVFGGIINYMTRPDRTLIETAEDTIGGLVTFLGNAIDAATGPDAKEPATRPIGVAN